MASAVTVASFRQQVVQDHANTNRDSRKKRHDPAQPRRDHLLKSDFVIALLFEDFPNSLSADYANGANFDNTARLDRQDIYNYVLAPEYHQIGQQIAYKLNDRWRGRSAEGRQHRNWGVIDQDWSRMSQAQQNEVLGLRQEVLQAAQTLGIAIDPQDALSGPLTMNIARAAPQALPGSAGGQASSAAAPSVSASPSAQAQPVSGQALPAAASSVSASPPALSAQASSASDAPSLSQAPPVFAAASFAQALPASFAAPQLGPAAAFPPAQAPPASYAAPQPGPAAAFPPAQAPFAAPHFGPAAAFPPVQAPPASSAAPHFGPAAPPASFAVPQLGSAAAPLPAPAPPEDHEWIPYGHYTALGMTENQATLAILFQFPALETREVTALLERFAGNVGSVLYHIGQTNDPQIRYLNWGWEVASETFIDAMVVYEETWSARINVALLHNIPMSRTDLVTPDMMTDWLLSHPDRLLLYALWFRQHQAEEFSNYSNRQDPLQWKDVAMRHIANS